MTTPATTPDGAPPRERPAPGTLGARDLRHRIGDVLRSLSSRLLGTRRKATLARSTISREHALWAYRLFLDREPESEAAVTSKVCAHASTASLRRDFLMSREFREGNPEDALYRFDQGVVIKELDSGLRLFVDLSDHAIGLNIVRGTYERSELAFVRGTVRPGDVVLDVGANIGLFTVTMAGLVGEKGHVYAYEPIPQNLTLLRRSIAENGLEERTTVRETAVGERSGTSALVFLPLARMALNSGGAYLHSAGESVPPGHDLVPVPLTSLDSENLRRPVRFIKIDVEGAEPLAFRGARDILENDQPVILAELNAVQLQKVSGTVVPAFLAEMSQLGYDCSVLEDGKPGRRITELPGNGIETAVFLPRDRRRQRP